MARSEERTAISETHREHVSTHESWSKRRNRLYVRNGEMVIIILVALLAGAAAAVITAYLGVR